jgi:Ala-tRNA(Pro) deacylase
MGTAVQRYLDRCGVGYAMIAHEKAITAQELAATIHTKGREVVKTVIIKCGAEYAIVAVPAHHQVVLEALERAMGGEVRLATETELSELFPECEVGAMSPLGSLYGLPVFAAEPLCKDEEIVFNAGTHTDAIRMRFADFNRLTRPRIAPCSRLAMAPPRVEPRA